MRVLATRLTDTMSITLAEGDDGWRFAKWTAGETLGVGILEPPSREALARRFDSADDALRYFRELAARRPCAAA